MLFMPSACLDDQGAEDDRSELKHDAAFVQRVLIMKAQPNSQQTLCQRRRSSPSNEPKWGKHFMMQL